jgi:hypothetical protein
MTVEPDTKTAVEVANIFPADLPPGDLPAHWLQPCEQVLKFCPQIGRSCLGQQCAALRVGAYIGRDKRDPPQSPALLPMVYCGLAHPNDPTVGPPCGLTVEVVEPRVEAVPC